MTWSAWITLAVVWSVITYFTARYFWLVLVLPQKRLSDDNDVAGRIGDKGVEKRDVT